MAAKDSSADNKVRTTKDDYIKGENNRALLGIIYKKLPSSNVFGNQVPIEYFMYWCDEMWMLRFPSLLLVVVLNRKQKEP